MKNETQSPSSENLNIASTSNAVLLCTPQAMNFCSTWQEKPIGGIAICYSEPCVGDSLAECVTELTPGLNPRSGCQYPLIDPFENTTTFEKDNLYDESCGNQLRYHSTSSAMSHFSQTFSDISLQGNEWPVAYDAFTLEEHGDIFHIMAHSNEIKLINLCKARGWNYEVVGLGPCCEVSTLGVE